MPLAPNTPEIMEYSLAAVSLILVWKLLDVAKSLFLANRIATSPSSNFACQQDPKYGERIRRIDQRMLDVHTYTEGVQLQIAKGEFGCQWKDREEVRDYIDITKRQVEVQEAMVAELKLLRQELVITRNGRST